MTQPEKTPCPVITRYICKACKGKGPVDEDQYRVLAETPGPLFIPLSQRLSALQEESPHIFKVTNNNASRETRRKRRLQTGPTPSDNTHTRHKKSNGAKHVATSERRIGDLEGDEEIGAALESHVDGGEDDAESQASTIHLSTSPSLPVQSSTRHVGNTTPLAPDSEAVPAYPSESPNSTPREAVYLGLEQL